MEKKTESIKQSSAYRHFDVWFGGAAGVIYQGMESTPEIFDRATEDIVDNPSRFFESEINSWNGDKFIHATASYSLSRGTIKTLDKSLEDPGIQAKATVSFAAVTALGGFKELKFDSYPDPFDMAANYAGWALAVGHEYRKEYAPDLEANEDEDLKEVEKALESND